MNWLDLILLIILGLAAAKGFSRGFIVEVCALLGLVLGIWAGVHLNDRAGSWLGLDPDQEVITFLIVFIAVLVGIHFIGKALTKLIDIAQLGLPNKLAGVAFGLVRSAFVLSVLLNILSALEHKSWGPSKATLERSRLHEPLRAFAPMIIPALEETKWVKRALERMEEEAARLRD